MEIDGVKIEVIEIEAMEIDVKGQDQGFPVTLIGRVLWHERQG
ncbi:hypothetical protein [Halomonas alkalisoli]|nr:hypothetical protein [Halomonas alkalisoli]